MQHLDLEEERERTSIHGLTGSVWAHSHYQDLQALYGLTGTT
jgi:hypothetical protein